MHRRNLLRYGAFGLAAAALGPTLGTRRALSAREAATIESCAVHPAIGVARVGDSPDGWFLGPEVPGPPVVPDGGYKDARGRVKRQAARFRVYGYDRDGALVGEVTADRAAIGWSVHLANGKAAWYDFDEALDIPAAMGLPPAPLVAPSTPLRSARRNASIVDRASLRIDPGLREIGGASVNADGGDPGLRLDGGSFLGAAVSLGELRTDAAGRLLVLGGHGVSAPAIPGMLASTFANNDLWHDDTADGPVAATVWIDGRQVPTTGGWVVVAPPNYAPGIQSVVTMYDVVFEAATKLDPGLRPARPSFSRMIYPLFARLNANQWVNGGFLRDFGWGAPGDFLDPAVLARLASAGDGERFLRRQVFERFRNPAFLAMQYGMLPPYYGDGVALPADNPRQWMAVLPLQYQWLRQWAEGDFEADWPAGGPAAPAALEALPPAEQPDALDRAALDDCLGGPFHPGCELTWPMRQPLLYEAPFRVRRRDGAERDWGQFMTSRLALASDGPLSASGPGDLTRWMAVPWQTDTSSCLSRYERDVDDYLPAFWPARVPNDVLSDVAYRDVLDPTLPLADRQRAFETRVKWLRGLPGYGLSSMERVNAFIRQWGAAGIVTPLPGPADAAPFPPTIWGEQGWAFVDDSAEFPVLDIPIAPSVGDQAGLGPLIGDSGAPRAEGAAPAATPGAAATPTP